MDFRDDERQQVLIPRNIVTAKALVGLGGLLDDPDEGALQRKP
jgi:hypothetical protein